MAKVIIECTDAQAKSIADSFANPRRQVIINRMLATDGAELVNHVEVCKDFVYNAEFVDGATEFDYGINIK